MHLAIFIWLIQPLLSLPLDAGEAPVIQEIFVSKNLNENATAKLICSLSQGENVQFAWYLNDRKVTENARRKIKLHDGSSELVIKLLSIDDIARYQCEAKNEFGADQKDVYLSFNGESI